MDNCLELDGSKQYMLTYLSGFTVELFEYSSVVNSVSAQNHNVDFFHIPWAFTVFHEDSRTFVESNEIT